MCDNVINTMIYFYKSYLQSQNKMTAFQQETDQYIQQIKSGANAMLVTVRVRPLLQKQKMISSFETIKVLDGKVLALMEPESGSSVDVLRKNRNKEIQYAFDFVFDQNAETKTLYEESVSILLDGVLEGYNATVLAYGATSCGKTYTMVGDHENIPGIMALAVLQLLNRATQAKRFKDIKLKASYIEIYNENIKDLLISQDKNFQLREDPKEGIVISGITEVMITNLNQLKTVLKVGSRNRTKQSTGSNQTSSRSHAILQIHVESKEKAQSTTEEILVSKLSLVDLAGSERAANTTNKGQRMVEGAKINQSLLVLGNCIQALSEASEKGLKNIFVPYRGSKLTRLLKDSLGGNCRTVMIAHVTPAYNLFEQTYNTLVYANRAKNIKNNAIRNTLVAETHLSNYVNVINNLKKQNQELKAQINQKQPLNRHKNFTNNTSLPSVQISSNMQEQIQRIEGIINQHFSEEEEILAKICEIQMKIQILAFEIYTEQFIDKASIANNTSRNNAKAAKSKTSQATSLSKQKLKYEKKYDEKLEIQRQKLMKLIAKNESVGKTGETYLMNCMKEKKVALEMKKVKNKQEILEVEKSLLKKMLKNIKKSMRNREKIIEKQKVLIKKNNIISRITYSQLDNLSEDDDQVFMKSKQQKQQKAVKIFPTNIKSLKIFKKDENRLKGSKSKDNSLVMEQNDESFINLIENGSSLKKESGTLPIKPKYIPSTQKNHLKNAKRQFSNHLRMGKISEDSENNDEFSYGKDKSHEINSSNRNKKMKKMGYKKSDPILNRMNKLSVKKIRQKIEGDRKVNQLDFVFLQH